MNERINIKFTYSPCSRKQSEWCEWCEWCVRANRAQLFFPRYHSINIKLAARRTSNGARHMGVLCMRAWNISNGYAIVIKHINNNNITYIYVYSYMYDDACIVHLHDYYMCSHKYGDLHGCWSLAHAAQPSLFGSEDSFQCMIIIMCATRSYAQTHFMF